MKMLIVIKILTTISLVGASSVAVIAVTAMAILGWIWAVIRIEASIWN
ncbi:hypothetical protein LCGC14_0642710 [marine sediment metagenome]|uniref:Uncharacterized protein n=1 Tax=marine sediment metagenome TaxID=412755 RepID=A0A0F9R3T1_9ZZZZ